MYSSVINLILMKYITLQDNGWQCNHYQHMKVETQSKHLQKYGWQCTICRLLIVTSRICNISKHKRSWHGITPPFFFTLCLHTSPREVTWRVNSSHHKMLIIAVNPSRRSISNNILGSPPSNVASVKQINTNIGEQLY